MVTYQYVALWDPESTKFQCYLGPYPSDWRTLIHFNVVPTVFHIDHISQGVCKTVRTTFQCLVSSNCPIVVCLFRNFSPGGLKYDRHQKWCQIITWWIKLSRWSVSLFTIPFLKLPQNCLNLPRKLPFLCIIRRLKNITHMASKTLWHVWHQNCCD